MRKNFPSIKAFVTTILIGVVAALFLSTTVASAGILDQLGGLFTSTDTGLSFDQFEPTESLELNKEGYNEALTTSSNLKDFIIRIVNFALTFLGLVAVIIVIYGGFMYITAGGEEDKTQTGKKAIQYATIGLLIVMGSFAFVNTIIKGGGGTGSTGEKTYVVGANTGNSFNSSAIETRALAQEIYDGFIFLSSTEEEIRNIISDSKKASLNYGTPKTADGAQVVRPVSRGDVLNFLFKTKETLIRIRSKVTMFSTAHGSISQVIRQIEADIDNIQSMSEVLVQYEMDFFEGETGVGMGTGGIEVASGGLIHCNFYEDFIEACERYPREMYSVWPKIQADLVSTDSSSIRSLTKIFEPIKQDYIDSLNNKFAELINIRQSLSGITAVESGGLGDTYNQMQKSYGYKDDLSSANPNSFMAELDAWGLDGIAADVSNTALLVNKVGARLFDALKYQLEFAQKLTELQGVKAHLRANVVTGNAPLVVTFDVLDSVDPAGGSIVDKNIDWSNLAGKATFDGEIVDIGDAVQCTAPSDLEKDVYGPAFRQCTFRYPGTYSATVKIKSNDTSKIVSGVSRLVIKVNPPTTKINLDISADGKAVPVMEYYNNGILKVDRDYIPVTLSEAKKGIVFDASDTDNVQNFKWDFGNGKSIAIDTAGTQNQSFSVAGKYKIELEVMNKLGEIDRKIFTLDVRNVAARISIRPSENIFISNTVIIDGSQSSSAGGKLKAFEWTLNKISGGKMEDIDLKDLTNKPTFSYKFSEPGKYKLDLKVSSELDTVSTDYTLTVESQPPKAIFTYVAKDKSQPSTVSFDGSASFDPDGKNTELNYQWDIEPKSNNEENWVLANGSSLSEKDPVVKFNKVGKYTITLRVTDAATVQSGIAEEFSEFKKTLEVKNVLDIAWSDKQEVTGVLDNNGKAEIQFDFKSTNAIAYELNFGDGKIDSGDISKEKVVSHSYDKAGKYEVQLTAYDTENNDNTIRKRIFIGGGTKPVAQIGLVINGVTMNSLDEVVEVGKTDVIEFDASGSRNTDGTGRDLRYSWDFGDEKSSSQRNAIHVYKDLSPKNVGFYTAKLRVADKDDETKVDTDEIRISVINKPPRLSSIQVVPDISNPKLITPVTVDLKAFGAEDLDGGITQYKWWYYNVKNPDEALGLQITKSDTTKIVLGTNGKEGDKAQYGFGLELVDSDNLSVSSKNILEEGQIPKITVINGANKQPIAKISIDKTSVFTGDKVTFTSKSTDQDGSISQYIWDFEGDGFFNDKPAKEASATHIYNEKNMDGYLVRLRVIDDKGGEAVSEGVKVYVDSLSKPPKAAFKFEYIEGSQNKKVKFTNNSTADEDTGSKVAKFAWDFDAASNLTTSDSNGDGKKDNDVESTVENPERLYTKDGLYMVRLTVTDNRGNTSYIMQEVSIGLAAGFYTPADPGGLMTGIGIKTPTAKPDFKPSSTIVAVLQTVPAPSADGIIYLTGNSGYITFDFTKSTGAISSYIFDKNIYFDTNGNGVPTDDQDFKTSLPGTYKTSFDKAWGKTVVKLTVTDIYGNKHDINQEIKFK